MKKALIIVLLLPSIIFARNHYTGYSGAPGSNGTCSYSCHGQYSFPPSVTVTGFPTQYEPGEQYTIYVSHDSGSVINQFNASVRAGQSEENAGTIAAGLNTETYDTPGETNGAHWEFANTDSGSFVWTAPDPGVGEVRLYWAGLQGTRAYGSDVQFVELSEDVTADIHYIPGTPQKFSMDQNYPNPFNAYTIVEFNIAKTGWVEFIITNVLGQTVFSWRNDFAQPGTVSIRWDGFDLADRELPSGVYFYRLKSQETTITKKMMLLR